MLKRIAIVLIAFFLCGAIGSAQHIIDTAAYGKWVDYINCRYAIAYIDKKNKGNKDFQDDFKNQKRVWNKNVKSYLDIYTKIGSASPFDRIKKKAVREYRANAKILWETIDKKKLDFSKNWNRDQIIENLIALPKDKPSAGNSFDHFLRSEKTELKKFLNANLPKQINEGNRQRQNMKEGTVLKNEEDIHKEEMSIIPKDTSKKTVGNILSKDIPRGNVDNESKEGVEKSFLWFWIWVVVIVGIAVWQRKWLKKYILSFATTKVNKNTDEVSKNLRKELDEIKEENKKLTNRINELERKNEKLLQENIELGIKIENYQYKTKSVIAPSQTSISTLYSDVIIDGFFNQLRETPNEDTIFELYLQNSQTATFTLHSIAYKRVIANPSFLEGCDKQVLNNAQNVKIESEGTAQRQTNGKWKIIKKLNVTIC